ncbi:MAG: ATP-binding protein [Candidatus Nanopusillus sp.]
MIIQNFKDRKEELTLLNKYLNSDKFEFIIIYGRRRIGKTELVLKATEKMRRRYYLALEKNNLDRLYNLCLNYFPELNKYKKDWELLFDFLKDKVDVIIIDEFQNLIKEDKNILSIFQNIVDNILKNSKIKLIIVGSSISMIKSKVLSYKSPLYGRRTLSYKLKPISFFDLKEFFPDKSILELIEIYGFADGNPYYLSKINGNFWDWLDKELKEKTFILDEVDFLMRYEFENPSLYRSILEAISFGKNTIKEIKDYIKVERTDLSPYLKNLIEVELIKRIVPIDQKINSRAGRYYINDNFIRFWFRYIYPNLSSIEEGIFDINNIKRDYNRYLGYVFEDIAKQFLIKSKIFKFTKIGKWWYKDKEIDLVAYNENTKDIYLIECKYSDNVNPKEILENLKEKSEYLNLDIKNKYYIIFAKSFKEKIKGDNLYLFDLKDLENIMYRM